MNTVVFDIETIPDTKSGAKFLELSGLPDKDIADAMFKLRREETGGEFLPHYCHRIAAISVVARTPQKFSVYSLGDEDSSEHDILQHFFQGIDKLTPALVSWNGSGFDCPVLHYRALYHGICAPSYWETGNENQQFRWNNYLNRYHDRHLDLMDVLAGYTGRANAPLDKIATMLGFPGKMGMSGAKVWDYYQAGDIAAIRNYCETDVLNTYLVYLRFQVMRGKLLNHELEKEYEIMQDFLRTADKPHFNEFLTAWNENNDA